MNSCVHVCARVCLNIDVYIINVLIVKHPHMNHTQLRVSLSFLCLSQGVEVLTRCQGTEVLTVTYPAVYI